MTAKRRTLARLVVCLALAAGAGVVWWWWLIPGSQEARALLDAPVREIKVQDAGKTGIPLHEMKPADALSWLAELAPSPENEHQITQYMELLAEQGNWEALKLATTVIPERPGLLGGIKRASVIWAGKDIHSLGEWAQSFTSKPMANQAGSGISSYLGNVPAASRLEMINSLLALQLDSAITSRLYKIGVEDLAAADLKGAVDFALQVPDMEATELDSLLMAKAGFDDAARYIQALYDRGSDERAGSSLRGFAETFAAGDAASAASWVNKIEDVEARDRALRTILLSWGQRDKATATAWVGQNVAREQQKPLLELITSLPDRTK